MLVVFKKKGRWEGEDKAHLYSLPEFEKVLLSVLPLEGHESLHKWEVEQKNFSVISLIK